MQSDASGGDGTSSFGMISIVFCLPSSLSDNSLSPAEVSTQITAVSRNLDISIKVEVERESVLHHNSICGKTSHGRRLEC